MLHPLVCAVNACWEFLRSLAHSCLCYLTNPGTCFSQNWVWVLPCKAPVVTGHAWETAEGHTLLTVPTRARAPEPTLPHLATTCVTTGELPEAGGTLGIGARFRLELKTNAGWLHGTGQWHVKTLARSLPRGFQAGVSLHWCYSPSRYQAD